MSWTLFNQTENMPQHGLKNSLLVAFLEFVHALETQTLRKALIFADFFRFFHIYLTLLYECTSSKEVSKQEHLLTCTYECGQCISGVHRSRLKTM